MSLPLNLNAVVAGLQTLTQTVPTTGIYYIAVRTTAIPPSGVLITLSQSGSQTLSYNSGITSSQQSKMNFSMEFNCTAGDVLTMAITSSNPNDVSLNMVKSTVSYSQDI